MPNCRVVLPTPGVCMSRLRASLIAALAIAGCTTRPPEKAATTPQMAAAPSQTAAAASQKSAAAADKVVCHEEVVTGSRFSQRVCETPAQKEAREHNTQAVKDTMTRPRGAQTIPNGG